MALEFRLKGLLSQNAYYLVRLTSMQTYRANFQGEIISDIEILLKSFKLPNFDILLAGFPASLFHRGKKKSFLIQEEITFNLCKILEK